MMDPCTVCGREFTVATNMYRHRQKVHPTVIEQATLPSNTPTDADATPGPSNVASMTEPSMKRPRCDVIVDDDAIFEHGKEVFECDVCTFSCMRFIASSVARSVPERTQATIS